jgi:hypothetical protein
MLAAAHGSDKRGDEEAKQGVTMAALILKNSNISCI